MSKMLSNSLCDDGLMIYFDVKWMAYYNEVCCIEDSGIHEMIKVINQSWFM